MAINNGSENYRLLFFFLLFSSSSFLLCTYVTLFIQKELNSLRTRIWFQLLNFAMYSFTEFEMSMGNFDKTKI